MMCPTGAPSLPMTEKKIQIPQTPQTQRKLKSLSEFLSNSFVVNCSAISLMSAMTMTTKMKAKMKLAWG